MINMLFRSAERFNPGSRYAVLTSRETSLNGIEWPYDRVDIPVELETLMLDRMVGQRSMVCDMPQDETLVFLDSDILVQADLSHLEKDSADVTVTWRRAQLPINGGVLIARHRGCNSALSFFDHTLRIFQSYSRDVQQWNGDQLALREFLGMIRRWKDDFVIVPTRDLRVRLLHSDIYNHSPPDDPMAFAVAALRDRAIVHFKGHRKRMMARYCAELLGTVEEERAAAVACV